jgi:hypothetical protein
MEKSMRILTALERFSLAAAVVCLGIYAAAFVHRSILHHPALDELERSQSTAAPDTSKPARERVNSCLVSLLLFKRSPLAILRMGSRDIQVPVFEGTDNVTLLHAITAAKKKALDNKGRTK